MLCFCSLKRDLSLSANLAIFVRQVRARSDEHSKAMKILTEAGLAGQMISVLRQELDSMVRVIYLLTQVSHRRDDLIDYAVHGKKWNKPGSKARVTDKEMVDSAQHLHGWTQSVYKFGCAFIHLSSLHDYNDRDPLHQLPASEREDILSHCRYYHGGPLPGKELFTDLVPYLPKILSKISDNLEVYLEQLEGGQVIEPGNVW